MSKMLDFRTFLSLLSSRKVWNALKLLSSYQLSRLLKKPIHWGAPMSIAIEPTTACNLRCPECPSGLRSFTRDTGNLKTDFYQKILEQMDGALIYLILYFQGEPFLNPKFLDMVKLAHQRKIYTITSTNGHFLNDANAEATVRSGLSRLIISIDGTTQETYQSYRKEGKLENVIHGVQNMVRWKKKLKSSTPHIIIQFLVVRPNEHQIEEIFALGKSLGVDEVKLKTAQIYDYKNGNPLIPTQKKYSRYVQQSDGTYRLKYKLENTCWKLWHSPVITWDGMVLPCCFDKDAKHAFGNIRDVNFNKIWRSTAYQNFRAQILRGRSKIDICQNCTEGCNVFAEPEV